MKPETVETEPTRYDQIEGEAYERYLVEVIRGWAAEEERLGAVGRRVIRGARLIGDAYPHWGIEIDTEDPGNGEMATSKFNFRGDPSLFDAERPRGKSEGTEIISDLLMRIFEGG
jgi:hypothetical protein